MDLTFWEAGLLLSFSFVTACVFYYWCAVKCCHRFDPEIDIGDLEGNQRAQAIFTITTVLMGDSVGQRYNTTCSNVEFVADDNPPSYEEAVRRIRVP